MSTETRPTLVDGSPSPMASPDSTDGSRRLSRNLNFNKFSGLYLWVVIIVVFAIWIPNVFLTGPTAISIVSGQSVTAIVAVGTIFCLAAGGFDLSIGQNLGLSAIVVSTLSTVGHWNPFLAALAAVALSTIIGVVNGILVARVGVNALIATLGMTSVLSACAQIVSDQQFRGPIPAVLQDVTAWQPLGVPSVFIYAVIIALIAWYVLEHTPFGRKIYATGANPDSAFLAGVKTKKYLFVSFVISGFGAGLAGLLIASKIGSIGPTIGPEYLLPAFAACFLGTTQLKPGRFNIWGTMIAIFLLATGVTGLQLVGGQQWITDLFNGVALIGAVSVAVVAARRASSGRVRRGNFNAGKSAKPEPNNRE